MVAHGEMGNPQFAADLLVRQPAHHPGQNILLPGGQLILGRSRHRDRRWRARSLIGMERNHPRRDFAQPRHGQLIVAVQHHQNGVATRTGGMGG